jgi:hypothetical protein
MMKKIWIPALAVCAFGLTGCGGGSSAKGGSSSGDLVMVNGEAVPMSYYYSYMESKPSVRIVTGDGNVASAQVAQTIGFQAMQDLIQQKLVLQMAADEGVLPTDDDILKEVEFQKQVQPNFTKNLQAQGLTLADIKERLKVDLARERILTKGIEVTMPEVEKYIKDNKDEFMVPAMAQSIYIFARSEERKKQVDSELGRGQSFANVAQTLSEAKANDGSNVYPVQVIDQMPGQFKAEIQKTPAKSMTSWIKMPDGWVRFMVNEKTDKREEKIDVVKKKSVQRRMAIEEGMKAREIDKSLLQKFKEAKIEVKHDPVKSLYSEFEKQLRESDKAAGTGGAPK